MRIHRAPFFIVLLACVAFSTHSVEADTIANQQQALQAQLNEINKEIEQNQSQLADQQKQRTSLERDVAILDFKIQEAQLEIKQRHLTIQQLKSGIAQKQKGIENLDAQVSAGQGSLAQILRETNQIDNTSLAEIMLSGTSLTGVFQEVENFQTIQRALGNTFTVMAAQRSDLSARKQALEEQQQEEQDLLQLQVLQQNSLKTIEKQKQDLVLTAKGQEALYQQVIANKQQTAAQIKAALFALNGGNKSVSFGDIYAYAKEASALTHVRPSLILGILSEESNLGQNVGTGSWKVDMNPTRDQPIFAIICQALGLDPNSMAVSKRPSYGWGGAMGPAQFIPSTWQLYQDRIAQAANQNPPNPWDPRPATFAAAILMKDNGADAQTAYAERLAALRYLAGWKNATKSAYAFYGNDVMDLTAKFQSQIDILGG